jgi:hypothetical protein
MKKFLLIFFLMLGFMGLSPAAERQSSAGKPSVAVVGSRFDPIEKVLDTYHISYDLIKFDDLEKAETLTGYRTVFFPCGLEKPLHEKINLSLQGRSISSVTLKQNDRDSNYSIIGENIRDFINHGGTAYFSGYAFRLLQEAYEPFTFFSGFPYMGIPGRIEATLKGDLAAFCLENEMALYMTHPGWIAVEYARNAEILATATYETPRGEKTGPISMIMSRGSGELIYTSYHSTVYSDFRRFNVYRILGHELIEEAGKKARRWNQTIQARICDAIHEGENVRVYRVKVEKGSNSIYFNGGRNRYLVEIFDGAMNLIESRDTHESRMEFTVKSDKDGRCFIRIFPASGERYSRYALVGASGRRLIPYGMILIIGGIAAAALTIFLVMSNIVDRGKYSIRRRRI